jgi:hypothetical protein
MEGNRIRHPVTLRALCFEDKIPTLAKGRLGWGTGRALST